MSSFDWTEDPVKLVNLLSRPMLEGVGKVLEQDCKRLIGRQYPPASSPGEPPARRTGNLQDSVVSYLISDDEMMFENRAHYALLLEQGGVNEQGYYIAPRPFMRPVIKNRVKNKIKWERKVTI